MGTLTKVANADYSANAVGKYDYRQNIFRRKVIGGLERNYISLNGGFVDGYATIDLSQDYYVIRNNFIYARHSGSQDVFSIADYATKRVCNLSFLQQTNAILLQFWFMVDNTSYAHNITIGIDTTAIIDFECEFIIDFAHKKITYIMVNGVSYNVPTPSIGTNPDAWNNGQTRTICCGQVANIPNGTKTPRTFLYFAQLTDMNEDIKLHFDILGDNNMEKMTDKAKMVSLQKGSQVTIVSKPITI